MGVVNVSLAMPSDVYSALRSAGLDRERIGEEARHLLALRLYRDGVLSFGKAACLAEMCHADFRNWLVMNGVPAVEYTAEDYEQDKAAVQQFLEHEGDAIPADTSQYDDASP